MRSIRLLVDVGIRCASTLERVPGKQLHQTLIAKPTSTSGILNRSEITGRGQKMTSVVNNSREYFVRSNWFEMLK